jgi:hypothetical protein
VRASRRWATASLVALPLAGCTWLVNFETLPCDGGPCASTSDSPDSGQPLMDSGLVESGLVDSTSQDVAMAVDSTTLDVQVLPDTSSNVDTGVPPADTGGAVDVVVPPDTTAPPIDSSVNPCSGRADGFSLNPIDPFARCCGGVAVETVSDTNCGVCGITCNTLAGQSCGLIDNHYLCLNCSADGDCWSGCCASTVSPPHCAANDCNTGTCSTTPDPCAVYGATCTILGVGYCSY